MEKTSPLILNQSCVFFFSRHRVYRMSVQSIGQKQLTIMHLHVKVQLCNGVTEIIILLNAYRMETSKRLETRAINTSRTLPSRRLWIEFKLHFC